MVSSNTTQPNKAADFWDSVYAKTKNADEATRQTMAKFGAPKNNPNLIPSMEGVEAGSSSKAIAPQGRGMGLMAANANYPNPPGFEESPGGTSAMPIGQALRAAGGQYLNSFGIGVPNAMGLTSPDAQADLAASDPALSFLAKAGGTMTSMLGLGKAGIKAADWVRTTGMSAKLANRLVAMGIGGGTGAIGGAANAPAGSRNEGAVLGGAVGATLPLAMDFAASGLKLLTGYVSKGARQQMTDAFLLDRLDSQDMTVSSVVDRITQLDDIASPVHLADAMGTAGSRSVKMIPGLTPQGQGKALRASKELLDAVAPVVDNPKVRARALQVAVKDLGLSAKDAKSHVDLLMQVAAQRRTLAKELLELSEREPQAAQQMLGQLAGSRLFGRTAARVGAIVAEKLGHQMTLSQGDDILNQLLQTQPMDFLSQVQGRMKDFAGQQAATSVVKGMLGGLTGKKTARVMTGGPGTTYTKE
jgi:hypothetical protein